jgi:hypothetical protein
MSNLARLFPHDDVLTLEGTALNVAIARQLGYRPGSELPAKEPEHEWFAPAPDHADFQRVGPAGMAFSTDSALVLALPLPVPTDCCEDWIHTEMGPRGRWIIRLIRFYRADASQPWKSRELYVADRDDDPIPLATAYGRAWLFSHSTWPGSTLPAKQRMTLAT